MIFDFRKICISLVFLLSVPAFYSCDSNRFFEENKEIKNSVWNSKDKAIFNVVINDILTQYDFYINLRNRGDYPYSNIFLFLKTIFPDGKIALDTIECQLADYDGKWLGSGISDVKFNRFLFQKDVRLPMTGQYAFEVEQAMRVNDLKGISDIGIRIENQ
jgi:gliding motility-associated lipoprotein GldH